MKSNGKMYLRGPISLILAAFCISTLVSCTAQHDTKPTFIQTLQLDKPLTIRNSPTLTLSANGEYVVYPADVTDVDTRQLHLLSVNSGEEKILNGTRGAQTPFFSPDGKWVGFFADGVLKKVSINGGEPQIICDVKDPTGGSWDVDNLIVFADGPVWQVPSAGGTPSQVTRLRQGEQHSWPSLLPNGKLLFNLLQHDRNVPMVVIQQMGSNNRTTLLEEGNYPRYTANGQLIYNDSGTLKAVPLDINRNLLTGKPVTVTEGVLLSVSTGAAQYSISQTGSLVFVPGNIFGRSRRVVFMDRQGNERDAGLPLRRYSYIRFSADGQLLAIEADEQILIQDLQNQTTLDVIEDASYPVWGPEDGQITFSSARQGVPSLYKVPINNSEAVATLIAGEYPLDHSYSWSSDGRLLAYTETRPETGMDIWLKKANAPAEAVLNSSAYECCPVFSPDGQWMAYISDESGRPEIYLKSLSNPETTYQLSDNGGREPIWSHGGKEVFYWQDRQLMVVEVTTDSGISVSDPEPLFQGVFVSSTSTWRPRFDVSPSDDEFVIIRRGAEELGIRELKFIPNWRD